MTRVELLSSTSPEWRAFLERAPHDFYHLPAYAEMSARVDKGTPRAALARDGSSTLLLPFIARPIGASAWDATSPYGYPGPLVASDVGSDPNAFAAHALDAISEVLASEGCVSAFVRLHPLLGPLALPPLGTKSLLVQHGETVHVDLTKSEKDHWAETMSGHRNEINRAIRAGHKAYFDESFTHAARFLEIYQATMSRVGASAYYLFDQTYLRDLREALGPRLKLAVVEIRGEVAAAGLFVKTGDFVQYHLSGTDEAFKREVPTKLMLHFVRGWAKSEGAAWLHLGGGVGGLEDSLFKFKAGFSRERSPFFTLRLVTNPDMYRSLSLEKHPGASPDALEGFFPLYRKPSSSS